MESKFQIQTSVGLQEFTIAPGDSLMFVGANGSGKTRLAVEIETCLGIRAHRISAHRAQKLNPSISKVSEKEALTGLRYGDRSIEAADGLHYRLGSRWNMNSAVSLLDDFDFLIQALFAEQSNTALKAYNRYKPGNVDFEPSEMYQITTFDTLNEIWQRLLPHRQLHVSGDDIQVSLPNSPETYSASEMSDGERAVFYLIGQTLVADQETVLIIDEPELHMHRSIMSKLWDELEAIRSDCSFVFITHDLEFAVARTARKYVIRDFDPTPKWTIEEVPEGTGFEDETVALILGSRRPILFVEGNNSSLDMALYRCCYPEWTVISRGSCVDVIHSVLTMRNCNELAWVTCAGIVDADDHNEAEKLLLSSQGIAVLPVSEIENLILLPKVSRAIAKLEGYQNTHLEEVLSRLSDAVFTKVNSPGQIEKVVLRYCKRRIDRILKKVDLRNASNMEELEELYKTRTDELNFHSIASDIRSKINKAVGEKNLSKILELHDDKGFLAIAAQSLKKCRKQDFEGWLTRVLRNSSAPSVSEAIYSYLPEIQPE